MYQLGQGGEPEPVRGLVADQARQLPAKHRVLVSQHKKLRILRGLVAEQHRWDGQQLPGHLVPQGHDHPSMHPSRLRRTPILTGVTFVLQQLHNIRCRHLQKAHPAEQRVPPLRHVDGRNWLASFTERETDHSGQREPPIAIGPDPF